MNESSINTYAASSIGIPSVVIGVLIALKHIGMAQISYADIIWFGFEVWLVCAFITLVIWLIITFILVLVSRN